MLYGILGGRSDYMSERKSGIEKNNQGVMNALNVLKLVFKNIHLMLISGAIIALAVFLIVTIFVKPTYEAHTTFFVYNVSDAASVNNSDVQAAKNLAITYSKILKNSAVLDAIVNNVKDTHGHSRSELRYAINVSVVQDTQLIEVTVKTRNPDLSYEIANSVVKIAPSEIVRVAKVGSVEAVNMPELPQKKTSPKTFYDTAVGFVFGVILAFGILYLKLYSDETIYNEDDIERFVGASVIGQIPNVKNDSKGKTWTLKKAGVISYENKNVQKGSFAEQ